MALSPPLVRPIEERDWEQVHEIVVEVASAGETYAMDVPGSLARDPRVLERAARRGGRRRGDRPRLGQDGPEPPGPGSARRHGRLHGRLGRRGRGVGRALAEHAVEWHREHGFRGIQFNAVVSTNTSAVRLWQSLGFETVGVVPGAFRLPGGEYVDLHVMYLDLKDSSYVTEIEIGRAKRGRRAYSFDDIAIVPSRRTRDPEEVSTAWQIDAYRFELPILAAPMDSVMSPETAIALGQYGGLGVLNLEGLWTRYDDPDRPARRGRPRGPGPTRWRGCRRSTPSRSRPS